MRQYTINEIITEFRKRNYKWYDFHFVGIRSKANLPNQFDDLFGVINGNTLEWYTCTTNPGTYWLKNLLNPKGCAVLKPNQYCDTWQIGNHKGYTAFVQAKEVEVYRDNNKNDIAEETGVIDKGFFGIDIHRAAPTGISKLIDKWSAGCQVLNDSSEFARVLALAQESKHKLFTYTLLEEF